MPEQQCIDSKWMMTLMSRKQTNIISIMDFDIRGFFGLREIFHLLSMD
jgi:hypothetical protein